MAVRKRVVAETGAVTGNEEWRERRPINAVLTVAVSLAFGCFLVWVVTLDWMLDFVALFVLLGCAALGFVVGRLVYRNLSPAMYHWERVAIAVILGLAVFLAVGELTHSHKLVNAYHHWSSDNEE
jgi:hypothetical protein